MGLIYMRISPSGGKYIGKTIQSEIARWNDHIYEAHNKNNTNYNSLLNKAIRKYGAENFSVNILESNIPIDILSEREIYWIDYYKTYYLDNNHGYNMTRGGDGNMRYNISDFLPYWEQGYGITEISKILNVRAQTIADYFHNYGISYDEIEKRALLAQRKTQFTFDLQKAYQLWQEGKNLHEIKMFFNLHEDSFTIRNALRDYYHISDEEIKIRGIQTRKIQYRTKPIIQYDLNNNIIKEWHSASEAGRALGITSQAISLNLNNKTKTCHGFIFKYKENKND